jgi:hypothetical protein
LKKLSSRPFNLTGYLEVNSKTIPKLKDYRSFLDAMDMKRVNIPQMHLESSGSIFNPGSAV